MVEKMMVWYCCNHESPQGVFDGDPGPVECKECKEPMTIIGWVEDYGRNEGDEEGQTAIKP